MNTTFSLRFICRAGFVSLAAIGLFAACSSPTKPPSSSNGTYSEINPIVRVTAQPVTNELDTAMLRRSDDFYTLGPGDRVDIEIIGNPTSHASTFVGPDGKIYYNLLPGHDVWGLTLAQARDLLEKELGKYFGSPQVSVTLHEVASRHIWLLGRVNRPGIYPLPGPMTLLEAIAGAGGTSRSSSQVTTEELADLRHSFVMREGRHLSVDFYRLLHSGDTSQNIYLQPNDFVFLPSTLSQEIYVLGAVRSPRAVAYQEPMTLSSAIAGADGPVLYEWLTPSSGGRVIDAMLSHVAIVRGSFSQPEIAIVNFNDIRKGNAPDVRVEPGDIVYVPNSPMGTVKSYVNMIVSTFVTTIAANEGLRAGGATNTIGVTISGNSTSGGSSGGSPVR